MSPIGGTGRVADPPDRRDFAWRSVVLREAVSAPAYLKRAGGPVLDQGNTPQCVAYASSSAKATQEYYQHRRYYNLDEGWLYARCKEIDGYTGDGTYARAALKVMANQGARVFGVDSYSRIGSYVRLYAIQEIKEAVHRFGPVLLGLDIDDGWYGSRLVDGRHIRPPSGNVLGGHEITVYGWSDFLASLWIKNSWGMDWGASGFAWLPFAHLDTYSDWDAWKFLDEPVTPVS